MGRFAGGKQRSDKACAGTLSVGHWLVFSRSRSKVLLRTREKLERLEALLEEKDKPAAG